MTQELRRDVMLPLVVLMAIAVLANIGSIALLVRMAPAIERIVAENVYSLQATEEMLAILASGKDDAASQDQFVVALTRAEGNVTEAAEPAELAVIRERYQPALAGDPAGRAEVISALLALGEINRASTIRRDEEAQWLGYAGAWSAVLLGTLSFTWGLIAVRRARRRIIEPLQDVGQVLIAARTGDRYRRCKRLPAPTEVERIMAGVDDLLDARALHYFTEQPSLREVADRSILLHLLDERTRACWIVAGNGSIDAANQAGLALLAGDESETWRRDLRRAAAGAESDRLRVQAIKGAGCWLCEEVPMA